MITLDRVVYSSEGDATTPRRAFEEYGVRLSIAFKRNDGWTLGAPRHLELVAFSLWKGDWTHFSKDGQEWLPIEEYLNYKKF